jgi:hypothetical protein
MRRSVFRTTPFRRSVNPAAVPPRHKGACSIACVIGGCLVMFADPALGQEVWISDANWGLGKVDVKTGAVTKIGQTSLPLYDIAFDQGGDLWGVYTYAPEDAILYRVDTSTAALTYVGELGSGDGVNGLTFGPDGTLYGSGFSGGLFSINTKTGKATPLGQIGFASAGDLAFLGDDLFLSSGTDFEISQLVNVSIQPVSGTLIGATGVADTWGLAAVDGELLGVAGTSLYRLDTTTGFATPIVDFGGLGLSTAWGMAAPIPTSPTFVGMGISTLLAIRRRR